jgi:hypothetical protein
MCTLGWKKLWRRQNRWNNSSKIWVKDSGSQDARWVSLMMERSIFDYVLFRKPK